LTGPSEGPVKCPDWDPKPICGNGLHGLLWGSGNSTLLDWEKLAKWLVIEVDEDKIVNLYGDKVKFPCGNVIYSGNREEAFSIIRAKAPAGTEMISYLEALTSEIASAPVEVEKLLSDDSLEQKVIELGDNHLTEKLLSKLFNVIGENMDIINAMVDALIDETTFDMPDRNVYYLLLNPQDVDRFENILHQIIYPDCPTASLWGALIYATDLVAPNHITLLGGCGGTCDKRLITDFKFLGLA